MKIPQILPLYIESRHRYLPKLCQLHPNLSQLQQHHLQSAKKHRFKMRFFADGHLLLQMAICTIEHCNSAVCAYILVYILFTENFDSDPIFEGTSASLSVVVLKPFSCPPLAMAQQYKICAGLQTSDRAKVDGKAPTFLFSLAD